MEGVTVLKGRSSDFGFLQNDDIKGHILTQSAFFAKGWERPLELGNVTFVPNDLHDQPFWYNDANPRNTYIAAVTPMDENGNFQVNLSQMWERDIDPLSCRKIILEVNRNLKTVRGGVDINIADVDAFYEAEYPIYEIPDAPSSEIDNTIGHYVAELVHDGDTIQLGIGSLPNACARNLMDKRDLGIHSEMFTNLMGEMVEKGVITGARKNLNPGKHIFCFAGGTSHLFDLVHENENCIIMPASYVTDPMVIRENDNMVSINAIMEIDLTGQVCSESIGTRQYSGPGGGFDFAYGAAHSKGGRSILIMHSPRAEENRRSSPSSRRARSLRSPAPMWTSSSPSTESPICADRRCRIASKTSSPSRTPITARSCAEKRKSSFISDIAAYTQGVIPIGWRPAAFAPMLFSGLLHTARGPHSHARRRSRAP